MMLQILMLLCLDDKVVWARDYEAALAQARATGKAVLVHLTVPARTGEEKEETPAVGG